MKKIIIPLIVLASTMFLAVTSVYGWMRMTEASEAYRSVILDLRDEQGINLQISPYGLYDIKLYYLDQELDQYVDFDTKAENIVDIRENFLPGEKQMYRLDFTNRSSKTITFDLKLHGISSSYEPDYVLVENGDPYDSRLSYFIKDEESYTSISPTQETYNSLVEGGSLYYMGDIFNFLTLIVDRVSNTTDDTVLTEGLPYLNFRENMDNGSLTMYETIRVASLKTFSIIFEVKFEEEATYEYSDKTITVEKLFINQI